MLVNNSPKVNSHFYILGFYLKRRLKRTKNSISNKSIKIIIITLF